jgi:hypothetical protein
MKIEEVEVQFAQKLTVPIANTLRDLQYSIPAQSHLRISLLDAKGRKKRSSASAHNWAPESGRIEISFEPAAGEEAYPAVRGELALVSASEPVQISTTGPVQGSDNKAGEGPVGLQLLLQAIDRAESRPGWSFVPLRKFRDEILPAENIPSMRTDLERQNALRLVIERKLVLVGKVPNPKAPEFPVTTIRLNRLMPEVHGLIGQSHGADLDFHPVEIQGEPLSSTILRERR